MRKQPIIALYFDVEKELKFYNLGAKVVGSELVSHLMEKSGQKEKAHVEQKLKTRQIKRNYVYRNELLIGIEATGTMDPFLTDVRDDTVSGTFQRYERPHIREIL